MKKLHFAELSLFTRVSAIAVCFVLACGLSVCAYAYMIPASYVSMDVNPSIEYTLNQFDRVLSVQAVNEDGAKILLEVQNVNNKSIDKAIQMTLDEITKAGYFDGNVTGGVVIATSGKGEASSENLAARIKEIVTAQCAQNHQTVTVESVTVNQQQIDEAKATGVSAGKLLLVQNMQAENPDADYILTEEWLQKSVREIMDERERLDELNDAAEDAAEAREDAEEDAAEAREDAEEDAAEAREDAEEDAAEAREDAEEDAAEAREDAEEDAAEAAEKEREALAEAADQKRDAEEKARDLAEEAEEASADAAEEAAEAKADAEEKAAERARKKADTEESADTEDTE